MLLLCRDDFKREGYLAGDWEWECGRKVLVVADLEVLESVCVRKDLEEMWLEEDLTVQVVGREKEKSKVKQMEKAVWKGMYIEVLG